MSKRKILCILPTIVSRLIKKIMLSKDYVFLRIYQLNLVKKVE
jgi:hypothetical protein